MGDEGIGRKGLPDGMKEQNEQSSSPLVRLWRVLYTTGRDYVLIVRGGSEGKGLEALRAIVSGGPLHWLGLAVLCANVFATAYLSLRGQVFPTLTAELWEGEVVAVPSPALYISLLVVALGWAYLLAGAASFGLLPYVFTAAYTAYYGLYAAFTLGGTPWFIVIPLWLVVLGGWVNATERKRWRAFLLLIPCWIAALIVYTSLGLKAIFPATWGRLILTLILFALAANPWVRLGRPLNSAAVFGVSFFLFGGLYLLSLLRASGEEVFGDAFLGFHGLLGLVGLFWYWVGLDLFSSAQDLVQWLTVTIKNLLPPRVLRALVFPIWILWCLVAYLLVHGLPLGPMQALARFPGGEVLLRFLGSLSPSLALASALHYDLYLTAAIALLATILWALRKLSDERLVLLFSISLFGLLVLWSYFGLFFTAEEVSQSQMLGFWPLLLFIVGVFWQVLKVSPGLVVGERLRALLFLGFLLLLGGISILELSARYPYFERTLTVHSFGGVVYLGIPYLLYDSFYRQRGYTHVSPQRLLALFALGMLSAIPCLVAGRVFFAPLVWLAAILVVAWVHEPWDDPWDGVVYALAPALGFAVFYTQPILIPLPYFAPFLGLFKAAQERYVTRTVWPWQAPWWRIFAGASLAAAILGYWLTRAHPARGRARPLRIIFGLILSLGFLAAWEFALLRAL